jgi:hypothetical protein
MTKASIIAATAFVWTAAFGATAALTFIVRPPQPQAVEPPVATESPPALHVVAPPPPTTGDQYIVLPAVEIVSHIARAVRPPPPPRPRDISEMHCSPWRSLDQGSNAVQICD